MDLCKDCKHYDNGHGECRIIQEGKSDRILGSLAYMKAEIVGDTMRMPMNGAVPVLGATARLKVHPYFGCVMFEYGG